ncbi:MAG TPA: roadblock/LC7 domain-containing protein [Candidatus Thermoplasmatota archaeon]|nr:roadblock/LC7 domain-containing protein [Candidatus Thermoplasmatota archaeon]
MPGTQQGIRDALQAALREGFVAASIITRDGINVQTTEPTIGSPETFAAMSAALVGAAEAALIERGVNGPVQIRAETGTASLFAVGVSDELLLVLVAGPNGTADLTARATATANQIRKVLAGTP